jgi:acyl-CoA synthetase (AMP-forming)/AMP-acid ligase II
MLAAILREAALRFGDRIAVITPDNARFTYAALYQRVEATAAGFAANEVTEFTKVALMLPSGLDYIVAYIALQSLGAITAGVNPKLTETERARILRTIRPHLVVTTESLHCRFREEPLWDIPELTLFSVPMEPLVLSLTAPPAPPPVKMVDPDPDRPTAVVFTSGTTGRPKAALFRERNLEAIAEIDLGPDWRTKWGTGSPMIVSTQLPHVGFMTKLPWYLLTGTTLLLLDRWKVDTVADLVKAYSVETLGVVAPQLALLLASDRVDDGSLSSVKAIIAGGAASPPALVREARERLGAVYSIRYSSTESGGVGLGTAFGAEDAEALYTIGRPRPGVEIRIIDASGDDVAPNEVGELCLRSPAMCWGYLDDPAANESTFRDGWLHTGDLASQDERGLVTLAGRKKEMYIRGGYNVYPAEVEAVLSEHPGVAALAIAPRVHITLGEIGVAYVVPRDPAAAPTLASLREFGGQRLSRWKLPEDLVITEALPLTAMDKLDRQALRDLLDRGHQ